jgi:hypothetical protein
MLPASPCRLLDILIGVRLAQHIDVDQGSSWPSSCLAEVDQMFDYPLADVSHPAPNSIVSLANRGILEQPTRGFNTARSRSEPQLPRGLTQRTVQRASFVVVLAV